MNRALLTADPARLVVQVDWIAGCEPDAQALRALRRWLRRETDRSPASIEVRRGALVPREPGPGKEALAATVRRHAVRDPSAYVVYVLYWDRFERYRGVYWPPGALDDAIDGPVVTMFVGPLERDSVLWLTRAKVESAVLVHEFGHVAGLVADGPHGRNGHCTDAACRMYHGVDRRSIAKVLFPVLCRGVLPLVFCERCRADLAAGRARPD